MNPRYLPTTPEGRLEHVIEECAEVIKAAQKLKRFGPSPAVIDGVAYNNLLHLVRELRDLSQTIARVADDLENGRIPHA